jgi:hypothetical protein
LHRICQVQINTTLLFIMVHLSYLSHPWQLFCWKASAACPLSDATHVAFAVNCYREPPAHARFFLLGSIDDQVMTDPEAQGASEPDMWVKRVFQKDPLAVLLVSLTYSMRCTREDS